MTLLLVAIRKSWNDPFFILLELVADLVE